MWPGQFWCITDHIFLVTFGNICGFYNGRYCFSFSENSGLRKSYLHCKTISRAVSLWRKNSTENAGRNRKIRVFEYTILVSTVLVVDAAVATQAGNVLKVHSTKIAPIVFSNDCFCSNFFCGKSVICMF